MRAKEFVFHYRLWIILLVYTVGFGLYTVDHMNAVEAMARWLFRASHPQLDSPAARHVVQGMFAVSALLITAAALMRSWGEAYLRTEVVRDKAVHAERLVADGPYRHVRNPLYLGNMLLAMGLGLMASRSGAAVLILGNLLVVLCLISREEAALGETQGEAYRAFRAAVPRLWPSPRPGVPAGEARPNWFQGILGEGWLWIMALDGILFVWTLNTHLYTMLMWVGCGAYFVIRTVVERQRARPQPPADSAPPIPTSQP